MPEHIDAVFEHGVFRPLTAVSLAEKTVVQISIQRMAPPPALIGRTVNAIEFIQRLSPGSRTKASIDAQLREERLGWNDR